MDGCGPRPRVDSWAHIQETRIDRKLPLGIWVLLEVSIQPESATPMPTEQDFEGLKMTPVVSLTPRLRANYTQDGTLSNVEIGDVLYFDISTLKNWLRVCEEGHGAQCMVSAASKGESFLGTLVSIVKPDTPVHFAALSYMWSPGGAGSSDIKLEKANISHLETPRSLTGIGLPRIILHAISLCRDLGEQFLWVDRLCIVQDDRDSKSAQIGAMDLIYRSASFTIVAALNSRTTDMGLPGHAEQARQPWSSVFRPPLDYNFEYVTPNGIQAIVDSSMWNRRGWTFQERLLSKRRLFITEHQAIFQCSLVVAEEESTWDWEYQRPHSASEVIHEISTDDSATPRLSAEPGILQMPGQVEERYSKHFLPETPTLESYKRWVEDYSSRQLSFGTDILKAFSGVASVVETGFGSRMLFGLPEILLPQCLLWTCDALYVRRGDPVSIPSWSWASCAKPVDYGWVNEDDKANMCSIVQYYYQDPDEGLRELATEQRWMDHEITIADLGQLAELPPLTRGKALPGEWRSNSVWRDCVHNPWQAASRTAHDTETAKLSSAFPGSLVFNTTVASVYIQGFSDDGQGGGASEAATPEKPAIICNAAGDRVGILPKMGRDWNGAVHSSDGNKKAFDCVVLGGCLINVTMRKYIAIFKGRHPGLGDRDTMWELTIMLVERLPCKPFIARRLGIGKVDVCHWNKCSPRWETVVIC
ncbi:hypothetical protein PG996_007268 [Apiospora saccharicola]|uniref:Heterokaryon incompatibility domain-containing protein n=1 Tax=Apiospora saccharicola TaxID=335842 RepID=A0ABR1VAE3_9PEZI